MNISFANQVAFISGAADGLGFAAAQAFADAGAQVALADINERRLNEVAETLRAAGHNVLALVCDVADEAQVKNAVEQTVAHFGRLDAAYNNVGIHAPVAELAEAEGADFDRVVAVNLRGVWNCMKYQLIQMKRQGGGAIVNCSSQAGVVGIAGIGAYTASKHAVIGLTKSAALDYSRQRIRINCICPGTTDTPMVAAAIAGAPEHMAKVIDDIPLGRMGKPEEIA